MKVDLKDKEALAALRPSDLAAYLRSCGWRETAHERHSLWTSFTLEEDEIALPLTTELRDYPRRIADVLKTLEIVEQRDQLQILSDLMQSSTDIIRIRIPDPEANDGSLPLDRAKDVVSNTHSLLLAAACATAQPKLYYASRKPAVATDYMRRLRMGQTERGSFVVTVLSRVAPDLSVNEAMKLGLPEPFERKVPVVLSDALSAVNVAASQAIATGGLEGFEESVPRGVSANLCTALAGLSSTDYGPRAVEISTTWARSRIQPPATRLMTMMAPDFSPVFQAAALLLKTKADREEFEVRGFVFHLREDAPGTHVGAVTVAADVDDVPRSIWIELKQEQYALAAQAHADRRLLCVTGLLKKEGRSYWLHNPHDLRIIDVDE